VLSAVDAVRFVQHGAQITRELPKRRVEYFILSQRFGEQDAAWRDEQNHNGSACAPGQKDVTRRVDNSWRKAATSKMDSSVVFNCSFQISGIIPGLQLAAASRRICLSFNITSATA
jgi:hypothetical protein